MRGWMLQRRVKYNKSWKPCKRTHILLVFTSRNEAKFFKEQRERNKSPFEYYRIIKVGIFNCEYQRKKQHATKEK